MYIKGNKHHATVSLIQTDENTYVMSNDVIMDKEEIVLLSSSGGRGVRRPM